MGSPKNEKISFPSICAKEVHDPRTTAPHVLPIYSTSTFAFDTIDQGIDIFTGAEKGHVYGRYGNPTIEAVADKIGRLEAYGLEVEASCILFSSGMAAISSLLLATLKTGDTVLTQGNLYGGTTELLHKVLGPLGIHTRMTNLQDTTHVAQILEEDPSIRLLLFETPANPTLACVDMQALVDLARGKNIYTAADNTFCTPYLQQPLQYGVDFVIHSTTKFLNGHGNSIAGAVVGRDKEFMQQKVWTTMKLAGTNASPWEAWLVHNGMKTLTVRMDRHSENALTLAEFLEAHPAVARVNYPWLESHPDHALAKKQMRSGGGMLSFELHGGLEAGKKMMRKIQFCSLAPSLGEVDTLILHPASMSHLNIDREIRLRNGITDGLIRVSVGIEGAADIIADLEQAMR
jgi:methionine-gamma-lyase